MSYQDDLILSMYNRGEPGLAMGNIPPGKGGSPGQPYDPPKPTGPYVPAPPRPKLASTPQDGKIPTRPFYNRPYEKPDRFIKTDDMKKDATERFKNLTGIDLANLADGEPDPSIMNYVTVGGFFLDGQGRAYMQTGGKLYDAGEYNPDIHGLPVPLAQQMQINPMMAGRVGYPHSNVQIDTGTSIKTGKPYKRVLPDYGAGRINFDSVRLKKA